MPKKTTLLTVGQRTHIIELLGPAGFSYTEMAEACGCSVVTIRNDLDRIGGGTKDLWPDRPRGLGARYAAAFKLYQRFLYSEIRLGEAVQSTLRAMRARIEFDKIESFMDGMASAYEAMSTPAVVNPASPWERLLCDIFKSQRRIIDDYHGWRRDCMCEMEEVHGVDDVTHHLMRRMFEDGVQWDRSKLRERLPAVRDIEAILRKAMDELLTERQRLVLTKRYGLDGSEPKKLGEVGKEVRVSRERVRQCERAALHLLRQKIEWPKLSIADLHRELDAERTKNAVLNARLEHAPGSEGADPMISIEEVARLSSVLSKHVDELEISVRSQMCLQNAGIERIYQLVQKTEAEMLKTKNFGRKSLNEIKEVLADIGLRLGMSEWEIYGFALRNQE